MAGVKLVIFSPVKIALGIKRKHLRRWGVALAGAAVSLLVFVLYLETLAPTVLYYARPAMFDSAMLQTEASVLGIGHPTGYPTYMMLTHLFTYLPVGDVAYRTNLASAVYGFAAVIVVYLIGLRLSKRVVAAVAGALAFGVGETFWSQAVIAEVYTLDALLLSLTIFALLVWRDRREDRYLLLSAFLTGLSLTHHLTSGLLIPAGLAFVFLVNKPSLTSGRSLLKRVRPSLGVPSGLVSAHLVNNWRLPKVRLLLQGVGLFLVGLTPYLYLPIRAVMDAPLNESDPSSLERFLLLITGASYLPVLFDGNIYYTVSALEFEDFYSRMLLYGEHLFGQFPLVLVLAGMLGIIHTLSTDRAATALLGTLFGGILVFVFWYIAKGVEDFYVFFIPAHLVFCLWISVGIGVMLRSMEDLEVKFSTPKKAFLLVLSAIALTVPLVHVEKTYKAQDRSQDYNGRRIVEAVAQNAEPNATVLHHRSPLWYMVLVEQRRQDLKLVDPFFTSWVRYNDIVWPDPLNLGESNARYETEDRTGVGAARQAAKRGHVYVLDQEFDQNKAERFLEAGFHVVPIEEGLLYELVPLYNPEST